MARIELVVALVVLVLEIYSIITCVLTPESQVRGIPKAAWLLLIVLLPLLGSALWLGIGRQRAPAAPRWSGPPRSSILPPPPPLIPPSGYAALKPDERIRRMEEDLARLERESGEDGPGPRG